MDVQGLGPGLPPADQARKLADAAPSRPPVAASRAAPAVDSVAGLLRELSASELARIASALETSPGASQDSARLFERALAALAEHNPAGALEHLAVLASLDPARAPTLVSDPALATIRPAVDQMIGQVTGAARLRAENKMADAAQLVETPGRTWQEARPELYILIAGKLIEAGGLVNYVRSAAVCDILLDECRWAPAIVSERPASLSKVSTSGPLRWLWYVWLIAGPLVGMICWWSQAEPAGLAIAWVAGVLLLVFLRAWQRQPK